MLEKRTYLPFVSQQSTQNNISELQTYEKNQLTFLWYRMGVNLSSSNNFATLGAFEKVSVSV